MSTARTWRGGEQQLVYLAGQLAALGVDQHLVCARGSALERVARERDLPCTALARRASVDPLFARGLARIARESGADLIHAHDPHAHTAAALASSWFGLRAPVVVHRRVDFPIGSGRFSRWKYDHPAVRRILCVSRCIERVVRPALVNPDRLRVVYDGIDPARFAGVSADGRLRREHGIAPNVPLVGNVAALARHKDYLTFVDAAARLLALGIEARFFAIGEGPMRAAIEARIRALGLGAKVVLTGFRSDLANVLPELDVLLFTSSEEGLGSSILDAYACRVPVVATAAGGIPEVVVDGETGLLAPVRDASALAERVRRVLSEPALRKRLVDGGARRAQEFSVEKMGRATLAVYREILGSA